MKNHLSFLLIFLILFSGPITSVHAVPAKPVLKTIEAISKRSGRAVSKGGSRALDAAFRAHGAKALQVARKSGVDLVEAAARHGDEVFALAVRVPDSGPVLAARAGDLLPLVRRHGDDFLRLEMKNPGLAEAGFKVFKSEKDIARLMKLPAEDSRKVLSYASHARDPAAARALLKAVEKKGPGFLKQLNSKQILAGGFSAAMITAAAGTSLTAGEKVAETVGSVVRIPALLISLTLCLILILVLWTRGWFVFPGISALRGGAQRRKPADVEAGAGDSEPAGDRSAFFVEPSGSSDGAGSEPEISSEFPNKPAGNHGEGLDPRFS